MKNLKYFISILIVFLTFNACKDDDTKVDPPVTENNNMVKIAEGYIVGAKAKATVYSNANFKTGYNEIYVSLKDSTDGTKITGGDFNLTPVMDMGAMKHSSPVELFTTSEANSDGYYKAGVVFTMPGSAMQWSLNIDFHNNKNGLDGKGMIGVAVAESTPSIMKSTVALNDNSSIFISLLSPLKPVVGLNDFEITLHKKETMMSFPAIEDYTVEIEPEMPSMGHGSPNNVNPVHVKNGHYVGKVNFTMSGLWNVKIKLYKNGVLVRDDQFFEITL